MKPTSIVTLVLATLVAVGSGYFLSAREARKPYPKPTPPPPPSPIFTPAAEPAPTAEQIAAYAEGHNDLLVTEIERALATRNTLQREAAFTFLLPELLQVAPDLVVKMVARQDPGEARETLRTEVAQLWVSRDPAAAIAWMKSLDEHERRASARSAVAAIAPYDPAQAIAVADEFGLRSADAREPAKAPRVD
jgi:hypothetical protein